MRIPVGYQKTLAEDIKIDDVVREVGKVIDVWIEDEEEREWTSAITGLNYSMGSLIIITESYTDGEFIDWSFPLSAVFEVLSYAKVLNFPENIDEFVTLNSQVIKTTPIFSSSK